MRVRLALTALVLTGCSATSRPPLPSPVLALLADTEASRWLAQGADTWEVWVCRVPIDTADDLYASSSSRLELEAERLASTFERFVAPYFDTLSHGVYRPHFVAGGDYEMAAGDTPQVCVEAAINGSGATTRGVLAVADAEHAEGSSGGFGTPGGACAAPPCAAVATRRAVYVGASDFSPLWGDRPPLDLVEHEMGHALGWPHSGYDASAAQPYLSALDLMSNSAAPRDVDPQRRDAPDTLALDRLIAGWLPRSAIAVVPPQGGDMALSPSAGSSGQRVVVLPLNATEFLTVELLLADGFNAHLPRAGVAVHRVRYDGVMHPLIPMVGKPPFDDLLQQGDAVTVEGWSIAVGADWVISVAPVAPSNVTS